MASKERMSRTRLYFMVVFLGMLSMGLISSAKASTFDDIQEGLAAKLDVAESIAGLLLGSAILMSAALTLAMLKVNLQSMFAVLLPIFIFNIAIGWIPYWVLVMVILMTVALFGRRIAGWFTGEGKEVD